MTRSRSRAIVVISLSIVAAFLPARAVASGTPDVFSRPAALASHIPNGATALGSVPKTQPLGFEIVLAPSHPDELQALLDGQRDPTSPQYEQYLAPGQFLQKFGPSTQEIDAVTAWLHGVGLNNTTLNGFAVEVQSTSGTTARALGVSMERYRTPNLRETYFAREAPLVPASIAPGISSILGLTDTAAARPMLDSTPHAGVAAHARAVPHDDGLTPCSDASDAAAAHGFWTPDQVGALYGVGDLLNDGQSGSTKKLALVELAPHSAANTNTYLSCFGLHNTVTTTKIGTGGTVDANGTLEANIDVEEAATQAPDATIVSYEGPNTGIGEFDVYQKIVDDDTAQSVSTSWGLCEANTGATFINALHPLLAQAAAQGQTVVAASGDNGSEDCFAAGNGTTGLAVDSPADDPDITGVGGTYLLGSGDEPVWNDCDGQISFAACQIALGGNGGGGGGGLSAHFTRPSWQSPIAGACSLASCREVPDVSANAGTGEEFRSGGAWVGVGGTSIAAPKIAGIIADVDTACTARVGDLAPKLVALAAKADGYTTALKDVVNGDNDLARTQSNDFTATSGYDLASGVGTPKAGGWSCPQITSLSSTSTTAGTSITLTGFALSDATIKFGNTAATITAQDATSATVVVPAGSGTVAVRATNVMGSGSHAVNFSSPGAPTTTTTAPTTTTTVPHNDPKPPPVNTHSYRTVASDGGIFDFGGAPFFGSTGGVKLNQPIVGMTTDTATGGYWFVARDGGIFGFHAPFFGSAGGIPLGASVIGMAGTADGKGYWLASSDGRVFAFGDAHNFGSAASTSAPIVGIAPSADRNGYWLAGRDGSIYAFGDAHDFGSMTGTALAQPIVGISVDEATGGYWMVATDGGIFGFHAPFLGSTGAIRLNQPIVGIAPTPDGKGYWMVARDGGIFAFGNAEFSGSMGGTKLNQPMVGMAAAN